MSNKKLIEKILPQLETPVVMKKGAALSWESDYMKLFSAILENKKENPHTFSAALSINSSIEKIIGIISAMEHCQYFCITNPANISNGYWNSRMSLDIEHVFLQLRILLDKITTLIVNISRDNIGDKEAKKNFNNKIFEKSSFNSLLKLVVEENLLEPDLAEILKENKTWAEDAIKTRDSIVHNWTKMMVFETPKDGILFKHLGTNIFKDAYVSNIFSIESKHNENNILDFKIYCSLFVSSSINLLNQLAVFYKERFPTANNILQMSDGSFFAVREWFRYSLKKMQ